MIRKLFVCPWFGDLPDWWSSYQADMQRLGEHGYDWLIDHDLDRFKQRCWDRLGVTCRIEPGTGKVHDYRAVLGILYRDELEGYDWWGHTDFDIAYGDPSSFDECLGDNVTNCWTDGWDYINGPWTLYRNREDINNLFRWHDDWRELLEAPETSGWVETTYSDLVKSRLGPAFHNTYFQTRNLNDFAHVRRAGGRLVERRSPDGWDAVEVLLAHFRRTKVYPEHLR